MESAASEIIVLSSQELFNVETDQVKKKKRVIFDTPQIAEMVF